MIYLNEALKAKIRRNSPVILD